MKRNRLTADQQTTMRLLQAEWDTASVKANQARFLLHNYMLAVKLDPTKTYSLNEEGDFYELEPEDLPQ